MSIIKQSQPLYQQVYEQVKKLILIGEITPGSRIIVSKLAEEYKISRTPLREALRQLENEGLLIQDNTGTTVIKLDQIDFEELCSCRLLLEKEIINIAVYKISDANLNKAEEIINKSEQVIKDDDENVKDFLELNTKFHEIIINSINNKRLIQLLNQTRSLLLLYRAKIARDFDHKYQIVNEHRMILGALRERNKQKAISVIEEHLINDQKRGSVFFEKK